MRLSRLPWVLIALTLAALPARAEQIRAFFYGNSLINHVSDSDETTVPHWLSLLSRAEGHEFRADGMFGDLPLFANTLPPEPNWSFGEVPSVMGDTLGFRRADFNAIILNPRNFVQDQPPDAPFYGDNPQNYSALSATLRVFDWTEFQAPNARFFLYEGWADMAPFLRNFPPNNRRMGRYQRFNAGEYHDWYRAYHRAVAEARPELDITLIPVASTLARLLTETPLQDLEPTDFYSDDAPHGTATLYFLASLITYSALYDAPPPVLPEFPDTLHPAIAEHYNEIVQIIWSREQGAALPLPAGPPPITGLTDPALAMGLNGIADWSTQLPFIDLMKSARPWVGHLEGQWGGVDSEMLELGGYLDDDGWPLALPDGVLALESFVLTDLPEETTSAIGRYRVTWQGQGQFSLVGRAQNIQMGQGQAWFDFTPGDGAVALRIEALDADNPIRNITILREDHIALYELGELFNPDWIAHIQDLRVIRFMDWMNTNNSLQVIWEDRPTPSDYTYIRAGVPVEVMVRLANQIGADPWFTLPHMGDDRYFRSFAEYTEARLAPDLRAYVEYSNEVWNFLFDQAHWAAAQAGTRWGAEGADVWMQYGGVRAAEMADIWAEVFAGQEDRLVRVIATQGSWPGLEEGLLAAPLAQDAEGRAAPVESFDAYAIAGYFGFELGTEDHAPQVLDWIEEGIAHEEMAAFIRAGSLRELIGDQVTHHAQVAAENGLDLIMYEGGTHILGHGDYVWNEDLTRAFIAFNYSEEMAGLYADLLTGWREAGGTLFNAFVDVSAPSQWGSWGALRHLHDSNPRFATLAAYNATAGADWETGREGAFAHGTYIWGSSGADDLSGTEERDIFIAGAGADILHLGPGDRAHGGDGRDRAVLPGQATQYALVEEGNALILNGPAAPIRLVSVEIAEFADEPGALYALSVN